MRFVRRFKLYLGIFIPFCVFFLMSQNTFAVSLTGLNFLKTSYSLNGGAFQELIRHSTYLNLPDTLIAVPVNATSERVNYFVVSGNLPSSNTGSYFNGSINYEILANADNSFNSQNCNGVSGYIFPEQGNISESQSRYECNVSNNGRILNVSIITSGKLLSEGTPTTWYSEVENNDNFLFSCSSSAGSMSAPCRQQELKIISATLNFNLTRDETVAGLDNIVNQNQTIINQNETIINNQNENTNAIINNQNENTEAIVKSNQNCHDSVNLWGGFNTDYSLTDHDIAFVNYKDGSISANGTATAAAYSMYAGAASSQGRLQQFEAGTYTLSGGTNALRAMLVVVGPGTTYITNASTGMVTFTLSEAISGYIRAYVPSGMSVNDTIHPQLEKGFTASPYEPFGEEICKNINEQYYDEQRQADENISNQSSSDMQGAENQVTTNLIGIITSFITELSSFSATDCNLTLPLPSFIGGYTPVNICQGKDVLGNFISLFSTLTVVMFYIPLAWILLKMIYNEIRSWTNG